MPHVLVSEWMDDAALARLRERHRVVADPNLWRDPVALHAALANAEAWVVRNQTRVDAEALAHAPHLKVVGRVGVGLDNLDLVALRARGVAVTWAPGANAASVAEYVIGAMLHLRRRFDTASQHVAGGGWDRAAMMGFELYGTTLGIVGLGDIGARVAARARAFGMRLIGSDPLAHGASFAVQEYALELMPLEQLVQHADAITLHVPLLPSTRGLFSEGLLRSMKRSAVLINTARGGLIDEEALARALHAGTIAGAALDVREVEPPAADHPLHHAPNVLLTPHIAGVTHESNARASLHVAEEVLRALAGGALQTPVR